MDSFAGKVRLKWMFFFFFRVSPFMDTLNCVYFICLPRFCTSTGCVTTFRFEIAELIWVISGKLMMGLFFCHLDARND